MKHCLVVDDSAVIRKVARRILEGLAFRISEAEDGEQALAACRADMPDAVLLDWNMPVMDGYEFLRGCAGCRAASPEGGVLHDRERRRPHRPRDACRRRRVHHEALRQGDHDGEVPGSRAGLGAAGERGRDLPFEEPGRLDDPRLRPPRPFAAANRMRVLVVDDSVVVRGLVARWLQEGGIEVVGTVPNGRIAVAALDRVTPDIVLLDLDMPELDGIGALPRLLAKRPGLSVIVVSTLTQRNAEISLKCLSLGALDYLPKPATNREVTTSLGFRQELVAKVEGLARPRRAASSSETEPRRPAADGAAPARTGRAALPPHRCLDRRSACDRRGPRRPRRRAAAGADARRAAHAADLHGGLRRAPQGQLGVPAREARDGEALVAGQIYVAPGGRHIGLVRDKLHKVVLRVDDGPAVNFCRPAVDILFRDAAAVFGASALAVVLTGMGSDGLAGAKALAATGAAVIAQDEATSTVWGMPGHVARGGFAEEILPLEGIAASIRQRLGVGR